MKRKKLMIVYVLVFFAVFILSALIRIRMLGAAPTNLLKVEWNETVGTIYKDLPYVNSYGHSYDLYIPANLNKNEKQYLILFIHGGSFNSGCKEDGDAWCKYYASKGYITATIDYSLQNQGLDISIHDMNLEIDASVEAMKKELENRGYTLGGMAPCGVSAGGTLAMNFAYNEKSVAPVKFVFQLAAPTFFEPKDWGILMKVDGLKSEEEFLYMMTGKELTMDDYQEEINRISPAGIVKKTSVPSLIGYGLKDHCVPLNQKEYLMNAYEANGIAYEYFEFPKSNHGMYNDLDVLQEFIQKSLEYCNKYFVD